MSNTFKCLLSILIGLPTIALALAGIWFGVAALVVLICGLFVQGGKWFRPMCTFACLAFGVFCVGFGIYVIAEQLAYTPAYCSGRRVYVCRFLNFVLTSGGANMNGALWISVGLGLIYGSGYTLRVQFQSIVRHG